MPDAIFIETTIPSALNRNDMADAVIREVRRTKERLAREFDFNIRRIAEDARARQNASGHAVVSRAKPRG